ncbi:MAG: ATP-binding cassette domain-containing protein [Deltaproteobacteria bacterium]|nr:MAG: ATP-binding cassette domain-containing protein [Deltaproteobacteria bacterium]
MLEVESLGKRYRLGSGVRHDTLRDMLMHRLRRRTSQRRDSPEHFWALRDLSFSIAEGEVVGVVGRNGAGKSTLLKLLSRITAPTEGRIRIGGRVASLLEVGAGFHLELSGRENIFMNGAILGMTRREIQARFASIVEFAEVERFLDMPIKRYSSGMHVRLAFAVAAHLEPEILLVDEVLAVGDAEFQKKCLGRMASVARGGRTVLFVSHNLATIQQATTRCLLLEKGALVRDGATPEVLAAYLGGSGRTSIAENLATDNRDFYVHSMRLCEEKRAPGFNQPLHFEVSVSLGRPFRTVAFSLGIHNSLGARLLSSPSVIDQLDEGKTTLSIRICDHHLPPGDYSLSLGIARGTEHIYYAANLFPFTLSDLGVNDPLIQPYLVRQRDQMGAFIPGRWAKV